MANLWGLSNLESFAPFFLVQIAEESKNATIDRVVRPSPDFLPRSLPSLLLVRQEDRRGESHFPVCDYLRTSDFFGYITPTMKNIPSLSILQTQSRSLSEETTTKEKNKKSRAAPQIFHPCLPAPSTRSITSPFPLLPIPTPFSPQAGGQGAYEEERAGLGKSFVPPCL